MIKKIVIIPSDPICKYIEKGCSGDYLKNYYNPSGHYEKVYILSIFEKGKTEKYGMTIIGARFYQFRKIIKKINPDIVRAYDGFRAADLACANKVKNIPVVVSVHDTNPELIHPSLKYADFVICVSEAVKQAVIGVVNGIDTNKLRVLPNRVNTTEFKKCVDEKMFFDLNKKYPYKYHILHIGRKVYQKNLETLIEAMKYLPREFSAIFVGGGGKAKSMPI